jgi:hypothetical protein
MKITIYVPPKRGAEGARATAYHEAGHAVVGIALGLNIDSVSMRRRKGRFGPEQASVVFTEYWGVKNFGLRARFEFAKSYVTCMFAGYEAQRLVDSDLVSTFTAEGDRKNAVCFLPEEKLFPDGRPKYIRGCKKFGDEAYWRWLDNRQKDARRIVRREKAAIAAVARTLMTAEKKDFTHDEIEESLNPLLTRQSCILRERIHFAPCFAKLRRKLEVAAGRTKSA